MLGTRSLDVLFVALCAFPVVGGCSDGAPRREPSDAGDGDAGPVDVGPGDNPLCIGVTCAGAGICRVGDDGPYCDCDPGFYAVGLTCYVNGCHYDCFPYTECVDDVVRRYPGVAVPCEEWTGSCPGSPQPVITCQRGCPAEGPLCTLFDTPEKCCAPLGGEERARFAGRWVGAFSSGVTGPMVTVTGTISVNGTYSFDADEPGSWYCDRLEGSWTVFESKFEATGDCWRAGAGGRSSMTLEATYAPQRLEGTFRGFNGVTGTWWWEQRP